jgi:hypothetical protein
MLQLERRMMRVDLSLISDRVYECTKTSQNGVYYIAEGGTESDNSTTQDL